MNTRLPLTSIHERLRSIQAEFCIGQSPDAERLAGGAIPVIMLESLVPRADSPSVDVIPGYRFDQYATILFTSGSTGLPKAALHTWGNHYYNAIGSNENLVLGKGDAWLVSLPLYHVAGISILFRCFLAGACVVVPTPGSDIAKILSDPRITHASLVGAQLVRLLESQPAPYRYLRALLVGGSALSASLVRRAHETGWPIHTTYGMTEMASQVTTTPPGATLAELVTSGKCLPHRTMKIGDEGEICLGGASCFTGYLDGEAVDAARDEAGWFHTGDLGLLDDEGWLHVRGRKDNLFISGGENIHPEEIERALEAHESIDRAVVVPVPDAAFGRRPVAFLAWGNEKLSEEDVKLHLETTLPRYMIPVALFDLEEDDVSMKISRQMLATEAERKLRGGSGRSRSL